MTEQYSCLSISREEFRAIYKGLKILEDEDLFFSMPMSDMHLLKMYLPSKLWRMNNVYKIIDKWGIKVTFCMNRSQHIVYAASLRHPRLIILKSRQQGISTLWLVAFFDDAVFIKNFNIGLMAQGQDEASTLLDRTSILWENLNDFIKVFLGVGIARNNTKEFSFTNGSKFFIRTSFRSATLQRLHISEMGKIANKYPEKAKETKTGTLQALAQGNIGIVESTAEGDNMFKDMWDNAILAIDELSPKDFMPVFLSWIDDPDCVVTKDQFVSEKVAKYFTTVEKAVGKKLTKQQKNFWVVQFRELGEKTYQEYPSTAIEAFMATKQGTYWAELFMTWVVGYSRITDNLYDENLDVEVAVDLGMNDTNTLIVFQTYRDQIRIIDEIADNGEWIKYYTDWMKTRYWFGNCTRVILPHDAEVTDMTSGKTRTEVFESELARDKDGVVTDIDISVLEKTASIEDDREKVRGAIPNIYMDRTVEYIKYCFLNYKKEWDDKRERFKDKHEKNEAEQGASAIRYMVCGMTGGTNVTASKRPSSDDTNHYRANRRGGGVEV
jgi:hypothetical protein